MAPHCPAIDHMWFSHAGEGPIVDPAAVLDHIVLHSLRHHAAHAQSPMPPPPPPSEGSGAAASSSAANSTAVDSCLPLPFALSLGIAMLDALPAARAPPPHMSPARAEPIAAQRAAAAAGHRRAASGDLAAVGVASWQVDQLLLAVCRLLDARPAVCDTSGKLLGCIVSGLASFLHPWNQSVRTTAASLHLCDA